MSLIRRRCLGTVAYLGGTPAVLEAFAWSWGQMAAFNAENVQPGEFIHLDKAPFSYHSAARNYLAARMLGDWLLMLDADHAFDPDLAIRMARLLVGSQLYVLTGLYLHRREPYPPVLYGGEDGDRHTIRDWSDNLDLFPVTSAGAGTLMVRRDVFQEIGEKLGEAPFDPRPPLGEDHSFFARLHQLGIQAWCAPSISSQHLEIRPLGLEHYRRPGLSGTGLQEVQGLRVQPAGAFRHPAPPALGADGVPAAEGRQPSFPKGVF